MKTRQEPGYLVHKIIEQNEKSSVDWREGASGNRSLNIQQEDFDRAGKSDLLQEAKELERDGLIKIKWIEYGNDIEKITYRREKTGQFYELLGLVPKWKRLQEEKQTLRFLMQQAETDWLRQYYQELETSLDQGKTLADWDKYGVMLFDCLNALEKQKEPLYQRVFSIAVLGGSKIFEEKLKSRVVSVLSRYHPEADDAMSEREILSLVYLEDYAQQLAIKGNLKIELEGKEIDYGDQIYGTVLTTDTLRYARILPDQSIRKIITVENKANFVSMPYETDTLIVFSHGFFSPLECTFLRQLIGKIPDVEFYHTGDLDYGGIRIFRHIREHICPRVRPLQMDADWYDRYLQYGYKIKPETLKKLENMRGTEPLMEELIDRIIKEKMGIEQECFLVRKRK